MTNPSPAFEFVAASYLVEIRQERARNLYELLMHMRSVPDECIFYHTFQSLEAHHYTSFSNDFAQWALTACHDVTLAEQMGALEVTSYSALAELRSTLERTLERYLEEDPYAGARRSSEPFYFCTLLEVTEPLNTRATEVKELAAGIRAMSRQTLHHHFINSRMRPQLATNDFSEWLAESKGLPQLAAQINRIDFFTNTLEGVRQEILRTLAPYC